MKTYLELEGKLGQRPQSQSSQFRPPQPNTNPQVRKESKVTEKRKRLTPTKKYKVKVITRPGRDTTKPPQTNDQTPINSESQKPLTSEHNPPPLEKPPVHASTPWPKAGKMSGNLFELRKDWPNPPANITVTTTDPKPPIKNEPQDPDQQNPSTTTPKPEQCGWGPNCPICKNAEDDWDGEHQKQFLQPDKNAQTNTQQKFPIQTQDMRPGQVQNPQCTQDYKVP